MVFMTLGFSPAITIQDGYIAVRVHSDAYDSGFCVAAVESLPNDTTLIGKMVEADVRRILEVLSADRPMDIWVGGPENDVLRIPIPPERGLEDKLEQAASHSTART
ncbi:MAG: hypothetical protein V4537_05745 [Pseudomonadota bacterium]